jgi:hypothetical protein
MAIYKLENSRIEELVKTTFSNEKIDEAHDLQKYIINSIEIIDKDLLVISSEFGDWEDSRRRIDILCLDKDANIVVIELKRTEDGGHMELQAIRYAAMVSNLTFDKAVKAYSKYIEKKGLNEINPKDEILRFLGWEEVNEDDFANDVRIILVSADFSIEITTTVLWLLERDIDIKCIRIKPQKDKETLYFDIQQIIPLPETADYQVTLKEKAAVQRQAKRDSKRVYTKYNITIDGNVFENLNNRKAMILGIKTCYSAGITPLDLIELTKPIRWLCVNKNCKTKKEFEDEILKQTDTYDSARWFNSDDELIQYNEKTYIISNQLNYKTYDILKCVFEAHPEIKAEIKKNES